MAELQATIEFAIELCKFYNIDLFQRGLYQVRCGLRVPPKQPVQTEVSVPETGKPVSTAGSVLGNGGACRPFQILYRNEEVTLGDIILFRCHMLVESRRLRDALHRAEFSLVVELWFSEQPPTALMMVSTRTLQLNFSPIKGLHYHLPVLFDYFHLSATSITIHATLVALHQPYINTPRSAKPWLGGSKFRTHTISTTSMESVFQSGTKCGGSSTNKLAQARVLHQNVCEVLLEAHQNLQAAYKELLMLLPQWQQLQNSQHRNATQRLKKLCESAKLMDMEEDFTAKANSDVAQLCAENIVQWQNFLTSLCGKVVVHQHLAKKHHALRVKRFAEAFFVVDNPRHSAAGCYDANYQNYLAVSELARRSKYLATLPPLPVHCVALDGDQTTMPIIFEDQYQDTLEFARRRSVAAAKKAGSDPFLSGKIAQDPSPVASTVQDKEDCSCGIAAILESRSQSRTGMVGQSQLVHASLNITPQPGLPARHSKSLDQLKIPGHFATMPTRSHHQDERRSRKGDERNGCGEVDNNTLPARGQHGSSGRKRFPYASRSTVDLALRGEYQSERGSSERTQGEMSLGRKHSDEQSRSEGVGKCSKTRGETISSRQELVSSRHELISNRQEIIQNRQEMISSRQELMSNRQDVTASRQDIISSRQDLKVNRQDLMSNRQDLLLRQEVVPTTGRKDLVIVRQDAIVGRQEALPLRQESLPGRQESLGLRSDLKTVRQESLPVRQDSLPVRQDSISGRPDPLGHRQDTSRQDSLSHRRDSISGRQDPLLRQETLPVRQDSISGRQDPLLLRQDQHSSRQESLPGRQDMLNVIPLPPRHADRFRGPHKHYELHVCRQKSPGDVPLGTTKVRGRPGSIPSLPTNSSAHYSHHCKSSDESDRRSHATQFPRSNSTQIFPPTSTQHEVDIIFHHSTLILSRYRDRPVTPTYTEVPAPKPKAPLECGGTFPRFSNKCRLRAPENDLKNTSIRLRPQRVSSQAREHMLFTSSSTDSESLRNGTCVNNGHMTCKRLHASASVPQHLARGADGLRHVRSASSVLEEIFPLAATGSESLPNLIQPEQRAAILSISSSASTSSLTSERSGWVSSRSVSEISSPEPTPTVLLNGEQLRSKLYELVAGQKENGRQNLRQQKPSQHSAVSYKIPQEITPEKNNHAEPKDFITEYGYASTRPPDTICTPKQQLEHPYIKKELGPVTVSTSEIKEAANSGYEEVRLPPPKQFRDVPLPPEPFRDPSPGPSPAIDNLLYHVYESIQDDIKKSKSNTDLADKIEDFLANEDLQVQQPTPQPKLPTDDVHVLFQKARSDFKSQLNNFSGTLYSDLPTYASTLPYFHISDEYRIFSPEGMHLIVCVHGLDGNSADLRLVKTYLELGLPGAHLEFLMSERNQGDTFSDFDTMTDRLVGEILYHMESCGMRPTRISFVGHSLGNIIIRSALTRPQMKPLLSRLHTFLSLSGPHLGTLYNSSGLVNMGMWFMQKWKKSGSLLQLCLRDASDVRQSFLYRLSQRSTLHYFKNVLLCGSSQDRYVPLHSARLELCKAAVRDSTSVGAAYREMVHNVLAPMLARRELTLVRYDVHHALPHTANALIGRAAHIAVLDSELFIEKFLVVAGLKYFR